MSKLICQKCDNGTMKYETGMKEFCDRQFKEKY